MMTHHTKKSSIQKKNKITQTEENDYLDAGDYEPPVNPCQHLLQKIRDLQCRSTISLHFRRRPYAFHTGSKSIVRLKIGEAHMKAPM
jgi:hypothetical protein